MGKVIAQFTMSLDGFIATPDHGVDLLFRWYMNGEVEFPVPNTDRKFRISRASADLIREEWKDLGAIVTGRGDFDASAAWGGEAIMGVPMFIVTHRPPQEWVYEGSPFTFVTEGVEHAVELAKTAAGSREVGIGGSTITQQCLVAGLLDEIRIDLAPVLLGEGIRLFEDLGSAPIELESLKTVEGREVTHLRFRVKKRG